MLLRLLYCMLAMWICLATDPEGEETKVLDENERKAAFIGYQVELMSSCTQCRNAMKSLALMLHAAHVLPAAALLATGKAEAATVQSLCHDHDLWQGEWDMVVEKMESQVAHHDSLPSR